MSHPAAIAAIRAVQAASLNLTLVCTEIVGPLSMSVSLPTARGLGDDLPQSMKRQVAAIERKERRK